MSTSVQRAKVEKAIRALPEPLRRKVRDIANSRSSYRHGSPQYAKKHPGSAVTEDEYILMAIAHYKCDMPFRPMEPAFKLYPASGNDAQRCAKLGRKLIRKNGMPSWFEDRKPVKAVAKIAKKVHAKKAEKKKALVAA
jgi:hypothetical protein